MYLTAIFDINALRWTENIYVIGSSVKIDIGNNLTCKERGIWVRTGVESKLRAQNLCLQTFQGEDISVSMHLTFMCTALQ